MNINISHINFSSFVDGPGERVVLFVQGCSIHCPGCQSPHLWPAIGGQAEPTTHVASTLALAAAKHGNVTLSGGEIFDQPEALAWLVSELKHSYRIKNIMAYTGYTWEKLTHGMNPAHIEIMSALDHIDLLVDGPFVSSKDDPLIMWRGSRNQRFIKVRESFSSWETNKTLVLADFDSPEVIITADGNALLPVGLAGGMRELGKVESTRMCGEVRNR